MDLDGGEANTLGLLKDCFGFSVLETSTPHGFKLCFILRGVSVVLECSTWFGKETLELSELSESARLPLSVHNEEEDVLAADSGPAGPPWRRSDGSVAGSSTKATVYTLR